jgi:hypothetical protein
MLARGLGIRLTRRDLDDLRNKLLDVDELREQIWLVSPDPLAYFLVTIATARRIEKIDSDELTIVLTSPLPHEEAEDLAMKFCVVAHAAFLDT